MISHPRRGAIVCALAVTAALLATPALADDIELPPHASGPVTGVTLVGDGTGMRDEPRPDREGSRTPRPSSVKTETASPTPSPQASSSVVVEKVETIKVSRRGTVLALVGAAIVSVLAGVVVFLVRD